MNSGINGDQGETGPQGENGKQGFARSERRKCSR